MMFAGVRSTDRPAGLRRLACAALAVLAAATLVAVDAAAVPAAFADDDMGTQADGKPVGQQLSLTTLQMMADGKTPEKGNRVSFVSNDNRSNQGTIQLKSHNDHCIDSDFTVLPTGMSGVHLSYDNMGYSCRKSPVVKDKQAFYLVPVSDAPEVGAADPADRAFYIVSASTGLCFYSLHGDPWRRGGKHTSLNSKTPPERGLARCTERGRAPLASGAGGSDKALQKHRDARKNKPETDMTYIDARNMQFVIDNDDFDHGAGAYREWDNVLGHALSYGFAECGRNSLACKGRAENGEWYDRKDTELVKHGRVYERSLGCGVGDGQFYNRTSSPVSYTIASHVTTSTSVTKTEGHSTTEAIEASYGGDTSIFKSKISVSHTWHTSKETSDAKEKGESVSLTVTVQPGEQVMSTFTERAYEVVTDWRFGAYNEGLGIGHPGIHGGEGWQYQAGFAQSLYETSSGKPVQTHSVISSMGPKDCRAKQGSVSTGAPVIQGVAAMGETLTATTGEWDVPKGNTERFTYQWYVFDQSNPEGRAIAGANDQAFVMDGSIGPSAYAVAVGVTAQGDENHLPSAERRSAAVNVQRAAELDESTVNEPEPETPVAEPEDDAPTTPDPEPGPEPKPAPQPGTAPVPQPEDGPGGLVDPDEDLGDDPGEVSGDGTCDDPGEDPGDGPGDDAGDDPGDGSGGEASEDPGDGPGGDADVV